MLGTTSYPVYARHSLESHVQKPHRVGHLYAVRELRRKANGWRVFSTQFKLETVQRILTGEKTVAELSPLRSEQKIGEHSTTRNQTWRGAMADQDECAGRGGHERGEIGVFYRPSEA